MENSAERAALDTLLQKIDVDWTSDENHRALLQLSSEHSLLPTVARFYRQNSESTLRRERCEQQLAAIQLLAISHLEQTRTATINSTRLKKLGGLLLIAFFVGCIFTFLRLVFA